MKQEEAKPGLVVVGRGKRGELAQTPTGWDIVMPTERLQGVDLAEWALATIQRTVSSDQSTIVSRSARST